MNSTGRTGVRCAAALAVVLWAPSSARAGAFILDPVQSNLSGSGDITVSTALGGCSVPITPQPGGGTASYSGAVDAVARATSLRFVRAMATAADQGPFAPGNAPGNYGFSADCSIAILNEHVDLAVRDLVLSVHSPTLPVGATFFSTRGLTVEVVGGVSDFQVTGFLPFGPGSQSLVGDASSGQPGTGTLSGVLAGSILTETLIAPIAIDQTFVLTDQTSGSTATVHVSLAGMARATRTVDLAAPAGELDHGADGSRDLGSLPGPVAVSDRFRISQGPHASYEVVADGLSGTLVPLRLERVSADESQVLQSSTGVGAGSSRSLRWQNAGPAIVADQKIRVASNGCSTDCGFADVYHLRAYETTLAVPRFNNSSSQITVLVLQNPTAQPVAGTVYFWSGAGALLGSSPLALAPARTLALNTASVPGVAGASGTVTVAHDAPYGALAGKTVAVEPATGFTFDTPLVARASGGGEPDAGLCQSACGNAVAECGERCDGADLGAQTCATLGFTGGTLVCAASCRFDTSACVP